MSEQEHVTHKSVFCYAVSSFRATLRTELCRHFSSHESVADHFILLLFWHFVVFDGTLIRAHQKLFCTCMSEVNGNQEPPCTRFSLLWLRLSAPHWLSGDGSASEMVNWYQERVDAAIPSPGHHCAQPTEYSTWPNAKIAISESVCATLDCIRWSLQLPTISSLSFEYYVPASNPMSSNFGLAKNRTIRRRE